MKEEIIEKLNSIEKKIDLLLKMSESSKKLFDKKLIYEIGSTGEFPNQTQSEK